jgi:hypothetical protein
MALPSTVTVGSVVFVVCAGLGLVAVASADEGEPSGPAQSRELPSDTTGDPSAESPKQDAADKRQGKRQPRSEPDDVVPKTLVVVYNNSGISGLAADQAAFLEGAGWQVAGTDNWYGNIVSDTVYYPPGLRADAGQLAEVLDIERLRPAISPMQFDRLTVIFTQA